MVRIIRDSIFLDRRIIHYVVNPDDPEYLGKNDNDSELTVQTDREVTGKNPDGSFIWGDIPRRVWGNELGAVSNWQVKEIILLPGDGGVQLTVDEVDALVRIHSTAFTSPVVPTERVPRNVN